jgi:cytochrome o ubiquinol oxidase subunit 1
MNILGNLTLKAFEHTGITGYLLLGTVVMGGLGALAVATALTYFKRWRWAIALAKQIGLYLWREWFTSLDPKKIGIMYIVVALLMLLRGAADAAMMRAQQALSVGNGHGILSTDTFQQVFSAHGTIMIFFVAMGLMFGLMNLAIPLQIGARDVAFPYLNSTSFYLFLAGTVLVNLSLAIGEFSAAGWLAYPPLSELTYSPGVGVDYWIWSLQIAGIGSLLSGINFLVTILKMRRPGMTLMKMPLFTWASLNSLVLVIFAFPILTATLAMLSLDRLLGMHFFTSSFGGNPMMYVNLIWAWGHPEVYILVLPAFGIFSEVVSTFSGKRLFGYKSMVWALASITFLSYVVWLHHFFTMGAGGDVNAFFGIMTAVIAVPTGVKVFNWLATMYRGRVRLTTPMLWFLGFVTTFTIGGATGVLMSIPAADFQLHNSLFLVAHFHNMIIGGVVFGFFAGLTYWFPKIFGFSLNERLGKYAFWCWITGFLTAFLPLYALGFLGATRRLDHYDPSMGWQGLFIVAGVGVAIIGLGVFFQLLQLGWSIFTRDWQGVRDTTGDPWDGRTLEWSTVSPAPHYNFATLDPVTDRDAFWAMKQGRTLAADDPSGGTIPQVGSSHYEDISMPKNTAVGMYIGAAAFAGGFALIWHIWWLALLGLLAIITIAVIRGTNSDNSEHTITAAEIQALEEARS